MNGHYTLKEFCSFFTKKLLIFILIVVLFTGGGLFYGMRHPVTAGTESYSFKASDFILSELLSFDNNDRIDGTNTLCDYGKFWIRNPLLADFVKTLNARFDMPLIDSTWNTLSEADQLDWVREKFKVSSVSGEPYYEVNLKLAANAVNYDYLRKHIDEILATYNTYVEDTIRSYFPQSRMTVSTYDDSGLDIATKQATSSGHSLAWYGALGLLCGILLGLIVLLLLFYSSKKVVSFHVLSTRYNISVFHATSRQEREQLLFQLAASGEAPVAVTVLSLRSERAPVSLLLADELKGNGVSAAEISPEPGSDWYDPFSIRDRISAQKAALLFFNEERLETRTLPLFLASSAIVIEADDKTPKKSLTELLNLLSDSRLKAGLYLIV